jgi:hypothetical protein
MGACREGGFYWFGTADLGTSPEVPGSTTQDRLRASVVDQVNPDQFLTSLSNYLFI